MRIVTRASATFGLAVALTCCGAHSASSSRPRSLTAVMSATYRPQVRMVVMKTLAFKPDVIRARRGDPIVWTNEDNVPHNVTWTGGPRFQSSARVLNPGTKFSLRVMRSGTVHYFCSIHPWMRGTIVVSP